MQDEEVAGGIDVVQNVIERRGEAVDVLVVERRHEGGIEALHDLVGYLVALVLQVVKPPRLLVDVFETRHQVEQDAGGLLDLHRQPHKELEEPLVSRDQAEPHPGHAFAPFRRASV